jgi:Holliday junction resolvase RusA-like endonuclease
MEPVMLHQAISFEIPGRPPGPNESNRNIVRAVAWRKRREWRDVAGHVARTERRAWEKRHGLKWAPLAKAVVEVTFIVPTRARRDWDNLVSTLKPLLDGIVDAELLVDDSIDTIPHAMTAVEYVKGKIATRFAISEPI